MTRPRPLLRFPRRDVVDFRSAHGDTGRCRPVTLADLADPFAQKIGARLGWVRLDITHPDGLVEPPAFFADRATAAEGFDISVAEDLKARAGGPHAH